VSEFLQILPLSVVMVAGPQIITPFLLATSDNARKNLLSYIVGALLGTVAVTSLVFVLANTLDLRSGGSEGGSVAVDWVLLALLAAAAVKVYLGRHDAKVPKWMSGLMTAEPRFCFVLGLALLSVFPTDLLMNATVGGYLASNDAPLYHAAGFWALTTFFLAIPLLAILLLGSKADTLLPAMRDWMQTNSWMVSEFVIALFVVIQIQAILSA
jgi:hypothetical protein